VDGKGHNVSEVEISQGRVPLWGVKLLKERAHLVQKSRRRGAQQNFVGTSSGAKRTTTEKEAVRSLWKAVRFERV